MSFEQSKRAWETTDAKGSEKYVLLALADYADDAGVCWPSIKTIAARTGLGERTVQEKLAALRQHHLLEIEERKGHSTKYTLALPSLAAPNPREIRTPADSAPLQDSHQPLQIPRPTPAKSAPRTYKRTNQEPATRARAQGALAVAPLNPRTGLRVPEHEHTQLPIGSCKQPGCDYYEQLDAATTYALEAAR